MPAYTHYGCRCPDAREITRLYRKRGRERRRSPRLLPAIGTSRRIKAMCVMGYSLQWQAEQLGKTKSNIAKIMRLTYPTVQAGTAHEVDELYRRTFGKPGPSKKATTWARKRGYQGPFAWDDIDDPNETPAVTATGMDERDPEWLDEVAVERTLAGRRPRPLTPAEIREVFYRGVQRGLGRWECCHLVRISGTRAREVLGSQAYAELAS